MGALSDWQIRRDVVIDPFVESQQSKGKVSYGCGSNGYDLRVGYKFKVFTPTYATVVDPKAFDDRAFVDFDITPGVRNHDPMGGCPRNSTKAITKAHPELPPCTCPVREVPDHVIIPPHTFALAEAVERIKMPRDCIGIVQGKSTLARCGLIVNMTAVESEWEGVLTIEVFNSAPLPMKVYANEGVCQLIILRSDGMREKAYEHLLQHLVLRHGDDYNRTMENLNWLRAEGACKTSYADRKGRYNDQKGLTLPFVDKGENNGS